MASFRNRNSNIVSPSDKVNKVEGYKNASSKNIKNTKVTRRFDKNINTGSDIYTATKRWRL